MQLYIAEETKRGIDRSRIVVGGISQGGAVALYSTFAIEQEPLAGIFVLSTWLPLHRNFPAVSSNYKFISILHLCVCCLSRVLGYVKRFTIVQHTVKNWP